MLTITPCLAFSHWVLVKGLSCDVGGRLPQGRTFPPSFPFHDFCFSLASSTSMPLIRDEVRSSDVENGPEMSVEECLELAVVGLGYPFCS